MNSTQRALEPDMPGRLSTAVLDALPQALLVYDTEPKVVFANAAARRSFDRANQNGESSWEELKGAFVLFDASGSPLPPEMGPVSRALRGETVVDAEFIVRRVRGAKQEWIECAASPVLEPERGIVGATFTFHRITERKRREHAMESARQVRDFIYHENLAGILHTTIDGRILDCNDALMRMLRFESREEMLALRAHQLYCDPADLDKMLREISSPGRLNEYEVAFCRRDGQVCWALLNVRLLDPPAGQVGGSMVCSVIDITERRAWEEDLRKSEQRFAAFMRYLPGVAFIKNLEGRYVYYNEASIDQFGRQPEEFLGKTDEELWPAANATSYRDNDAQVVSNRRHYEFIETVQHTDGPHSWMVYKFPIMENGDVILVGGVGIDITERLVMEQQLLQARKMDALGLLAGGVAHDFNNLLTVISGYGQLAVESLSDHGDPRMADYLTHMLDGARRASGITGQLLAFSRREVVKRSVLDLGEVLAGIEKLLRTMVGEHVDLQIDPGSEPCLVLSDENQMQQVIINLAVNARDAMPLGGELNISCKKIGPGEEEGGSDPLEILLEVRDQGVGMDEATVNRIFEPFFTSKGKGKGTGLGLSTVYGIVSQAGGKIDVESSVGEGTTFRIYFPAALGAKANLQSYRAPENLSGTERVLLVEDEASVRALARTILGRLGYRVTEAECGPHALQLWEHNRGRFDVLVSDVVMPQMSGGDLAIALRERNPHLKVLFMSGYAGDMLSRNGVLEGQTQLLAKPFTPEALGRKLRDVLDA